MSWFTSLEAWMTLFTLTALKIVRGIDNTAFISILADNLPAEQQILGRQLG